MIEWSIWSETFGRVCTIEVNSIIMSYVHKIKFQKLLNEKEIESNIFKSNIFKNKRIQAINPSIPWKLLRI